MARGSAMATALTEEQKRKIAKLIFSYFCDLYNERERNLPLPQAFVYLLEKGVTDSGLTEWVYKNFDKAIEYVPD